MQLHNDMVLRREPTGNPLTEAGYPVAVSTLATMASCDSGAVDVVLAGLLDLARGTGLTADLPGEVETVDLLVHSLFAALDPSCGVET